MSKAQALALILRESFIQQMSMKNFEMVPIFNNLKEVKFHVGCNFDWEVLLKFLKSTPNLQLLSFSRGLVRVRTDGRGFYLEPECLSLKLKIIDVYDFVGFEEELQFVRYLLECCKVLDEMIISRFDFRLKPRIKKMEEWEWITSELLKFQRGSKTCEIVFTA